MDLLGHVEVEAKFISPSTDESLSLTALIDTGATFTTLPASVSEKLRLPQITRRRVRTASGWEEMPESYVIIEILGQKTTMPVMISEKLDRALIGVLTLEALALKVDPKNGERYLAWLFESCD